MRASIAAMLCALFLAVPSGICNDQFAAALPTGVQAVWDLGGADRETTATRERICINGLGRWQPARRQPGQVPAKDWGFFKVPGCWPGITNYMQKDCQTVYTHAGWKEPYAAGKLSSDQVLIVGPRGAKRLARDTTAIAGWLRGGGRLLVIGLDENDVRALPFSKVRLRKAEHISALLRTTGHPIAFGGRWTGSTPIATRFHQPVATANAQKRWQDGLYLDQPEEWDDPYRFFRW